MDDDRAVSFLVSRNVVPFVRDKLVALGEKPTAVLVLNGCPAHPNLEDLVSDDEAVTAMFLPANVTSLIQPMDQGVIQSVKKRYKKMLLRRLIIQDDRGKSVVEYLKEVNMHVVADLVSKAWSDITNSTLRKSWRKILPITPAPSVQASQGGYGLWSGIRVRIGEIRSDEFEEVTSKKNDREENDKQAANVDTNYFCALFKVLGVAVVDDAGEQVDVPTDEFFTLFHELGVAVDATTIEEWLQSDSCLTGGPIYTDDGLCQLIKQQSTTGDMQEDEDEEDDSDDETDASLCPISYSDAARMFEWCLSWL